MGLAALFESGPCQYFLSDATCRNRFCETLPGSGLAPPFIVAASDDPAGIEAVVQRSVCVHQCIEVWGEGATWDECHAAVRAYSDANKIPFTCEGTTFKLDFVCRGRKFSNTVKQALMKVLKFSVRFATLFVPTYHLAYWRCRL